MVKLKQKDWFRLLMLRCVLVNKRETESETEKGCADLQCVRQQGQPIPGEVLAF